MRRVSCQHILPESSHGHGIGLYLARLGHEEWDCIAGSRRLRSGGDAQCAYSGPETEHGVGGFMTREKHPLRESAAVLNGKGCAWEPESVGMQRGALNDPDTVVVYGEAPRKCNWG
jgi:hypothetical protein